MFTFANFVELANAASPIVSIVSGKYISTKFAPSNPFSAIVVTVFPSNVEGITIYRARLL